MVFMAQPPPPDGFTLSELRRGVAFVGPHDGTQARRRRRDTFRVALEQWVIAGGRCDLLDRSNLDNSPVAHLTAGLQAMALGPASRIGPVPASSVTSEAMFGPSEDGFCYLVAVRSDAHNQAADDLGPSPWRAAALAWLLEHPSVHSGHKFSATLVPSAGGIVQLHLAVSGHPGALTWSEAFSLGPANTRVGGTASGHDAGPDRDAADRCGRAAAPSGPAAQSSRSSEQATDEFGDDPDQRPVVAQQIPTNLPDLGHHPVILVDGLEAWFRTLSREYARIFLRYLFKFDPDQSSPAPGLFVQPVSTYRLAAVYDMSPLPFRDTFLRNVVWRGLEDEVVPPGVEGYCYLQLLEPAVRAKAATALGSKPGAGEVRRYPLGSGRFRVELTGHGLYHVSVAQEGLTAEQVLRALPADSRVGAAIGDKLALTEAGIASLAVGSPTGFDIVPSGPRTTLTLAMYAILDKGTHNSTISWSPLAQSAFAIMLGVYESVRLESAEFNISVAAGQANTCWCAVANASAPAPSAAEWYSCPILKVVHGSDDGEVVSDFKLPGSHSFSKELRAALPGNDPPRFHFGYTGVAGGNATVMGRFVVSVSGQKPLGAFDANPAKAPKVTREVRRLMSSMPSIHPSVCSLDEDAESSDEDEDEDEPGPSSGTRRSPPNRA